MRKFGMTLTVFAGLLAALLVMGGAGPASGGGTKPKDDAAALKKGLKKLDPDIRASRASLEKAKNELENVRSRLKHALKDEVFGEKGTIQGKVLNRLNDALEQSNRALDRVNAAIKAVVSAQVVNKGGN